eukprot:1139186-Pelagomonas_calceolata.AAC.3
MTQLSSLAWSVGCPPVACTFSLACEQGVHILYRGCCHEAVGFVQACPSMRADGCPITNPYIMLCMLLGGGDVLVCDGKGLQPAWHSCDGLQGQLS